MDAALKHDTDKPAITLLSRVFLVGVTRALMFGTKKYVKNNWRGGMEWSRVLDAALRHILAWAEGEEVDPESGLSHLHHAACNLMFLSEYQERGVGIDDRWIASHLGSTNTGQNDG